MGLYFRKGISPFNIKPDKRYGIKINHQPYFKGAVSVDARANWEGMIYGILSQERNLKGNQKNEI
jgi:hypothetical protein